tara:strand:+ start:833 stop:1231 length:399 start_codon:yes stop_codon:yes gene_type:complete
MKKPSEDKLQTAVITYLRLEHRALYCASLGGQYQKYHSQRKKAKRNGYVKGFPDVFVYEPKGDYNGLAIELKAIGESPYKKNGNLKKLYAKGGDRHNQIIWLNNLNDRGYLAKVCTGFDEAKECIDNYFNLK